MRRNSSPQTVRAQTVQEQLREALSILDAVADGILIIDDAGTIVDVNSAAQTLFGIERDEVAGRHLSLLLPDAAVSLPVEKLLAESGAKGGLDVGARDVNSETIPVHLTISRSIGQGSARYVLVVRDFRTIQTAQQRVLETERLAAIGETMTALAHESRNALQRMQSCLTLLRLRGGEQVRELVDDMQEAQEQLQRLYEEVRSFAAPLQLEPRKTDVRKLLDRTWRQLRVQWAPRKLGWSVDQAERLDTSVQADATRLGQVFRNILENAIEASPEQGRIFARLRAREAGPGIEIALEDQGPGIEPAVEERVFDLLYTTREGGTGMGLAIARRIVREHDGDVSVGKAPGGGARIVVRLPRGRPE